jgi:hypothetical protein
MKPSGAHTHPGGGSGIGAAVLVVLAAVVIVKAAGPVVAALAELVRLVLIAVAVVAGLALAGGTAFVAVRLRQRRAIGAVRVHRAAPLTRQAAEPLPAPRRSAAALPAIEAPREVHIHLHGTSAEDLAEALRQLPGEPGR